jgi:hypothetical protein
VSVDLDINPGIKRFNDGFEKLSKLHDLNSTFIDNLRSRISEEPFIANDLYGSLENKYNELSKFVSRINKGATPTGEEYKTQLENLNKLTEQHTNLQTLSDSYNQGTRQALEIYTAVLGIIVGGIVLPRVASFLSSLSRLPLPRLTTDPALSAGGAGISALTNNPAIANSILFWGALYYGGKMFVMMNQMMGDGSSGQNLQSAADRQATQLIEKAKSATKPPSESFGDLENSAGEFIVLIQHEGNLLAAKLSNTKIFMLTKPGAAVSLPKWFDGGAKIDHAKATLDNVFKAILKNKKVTEISEKQLIENNWIKFLTPP